MALAKCNKSISRGVVLLCSKTNLLVAAFFTCLSGEVEVAGFCFTEDPVAELCFLSFPPSAKTREAYPQYDGTAVGKQDMHLPVLVQSSSSFCPHQLYGLPAMKHNWNGCF